MTERSDDDVAGRMKALEHLEVPDQWNDIVARAARGPEVVHLVHAPTAGSGRSRRSRLLAASAAALVLVVVGAALGRVTDNHSPDVRTRDPVPGVSVWRLGAAVDVPIVDAGAAPLVSAAAGQAVAAVHGGRAIVVVDGAGTKTAVPLAGAVEALGAGALGSGEPIAAVLLSSGRLVRVDAAGRVTTIRELGSIPSSAPSVALTQDRVFVSGTSAGGLVAIDLASPSSAPTVITTDTPSQLSVKGGILWALEQPRDTLVRIDAKTGRVTATVKAQGAIAIAATPLGVFLVRPAAARLSFVGTRLRITDIAQIDRSASSIAASNHEIWIGSYGVFSAFRMRDARLLSAVGQFAPGDAALASDGETVWELTSNDGLRELVPTS